MARVGVWRVTAAPVNDQTPAVYHVLAPNIPAAAVKALALDSTHPDHLLRTSVTIERLVEADFDLAEMAAPVASATTR
jgi:hypothetical protein